MHVYEAILLILSILLCTLIVTGNGLNDKLGYCTALVRLNEWASNLILFVL